MGSQSEEYRQSQHSLSVLSVLVRSVNYRNLAIIIKRISNNLKSIWRTVSRNTNEYM